MSITLYPYTGDGYGDPVPVMDAFALYDECKANNISTDRWFSLANTITMVAGEDSSTAYLLTTKKYIDGCTAQQNNGTEVLPIDRSEYNHKIVLHDSFRMQLGENPVETAGWVFHSCFAIDGSNDPDDINAVYLVKFVDRRWLFAKQPNVTGISGGLLYAVKGQDGIAPFYGGGINVVAPTVTDSTAGEAYVADPDTVTYDPGVPSDFPYVNGTTGVFDSVSWEEALNWLWFVDAFTDDYGSTLGFNSDLLPSGGVYPDQNPIDFLLDNKPTWKAFVELLHASGNEIYPWLDGTFRILPIDDHFGSDPELADYEPYLIEANHPKPMELGLPEYMTLTMRARSLGEFPTTTSLVNDYYTLILPIKTVHDSDGLINTTEYEAAQENGAYILSGSDIVPGSEILVGAVEDVITPAMAHLTGPASSGTYTHARNYAKDVLARLIRSRADGWIDNTYGYFIGISPSAEFEKVTWFLTPNGPATRFQSLPSTIGVSEVVSAPGGGGGGGGSDDHLVKADDDDDTPETFYTTVVDHDTFDEMLHQEVFAQVITESAGPPTNTRVKLFTTLGAGDQGPPGEQGEPGEPGPTYTAGCGIIIASTTVAVFASELVSDSIQVDPNTTTACSIAVLNTGIIDTGIEVTSGDTERIRVKPGDIAGCGLIAASDNGTNQGDRCKVKINPTALLSAGGGLQAANDNATGYLGPCRIMINPADLCGDGIAEQAGNQDDANGPVKIKVNPNVTIKVPTSIELFQEDDKLKVRLNYTNYDVYGVIGSTGSLTGEEDTTECPVE